MDTYRVTLGDKVSEAKTKWHHFPVEADCFEGAVAKARTLFERTVGRNPVPFLCLRFDPETREPDGVWKHWKGEWSEQSLDEYAEEQLAFREKVAEQRRQRDALVDKANAANRALLQQFGDLADAGRALAETDFSEDGARTEFLKALERVTFV